MVRTRAKNIAHLKKSENADEPVIGDDDLFCHKQLEQCIEMSYHDYANYPE